MKIKLLRDWLISFAIVILEKLGVFVAIVGYTMWQFLFLQGLLFWIVNNYHVAYFEIFIIQFPITLWVLLNNAKNKKGG